MTPIKLPVKTFSFKVEVSTFSQGPYGSGETFRAAALQMQIWEQGKDLSDHCHLGYGIKHQAKPKGFCFGCFCIGSMKIGKKTAREVVKSLTFRKSLCGRHR